MAASPKHGGDLWLGASSSKSRVSGRVLTTGVRSSLGIVLDLSGAGMRVRCKGRGPEEGTTLRVRIENGSNELELTGRVLWRRRTGWFTTELGLVFEELDDAARSALATIARSAAIDTSVGRLAS